MQFLLKELPLKQEEIKFSFQTEKKIYMPRLVSWHGDGSYSYSGRNFKPNSWTLSLLFLKQEVEKVSPIKFNSVLVNYYRDGSDSISWHSDNESEIDDACIASVSLGYPRKFFLKETSSGQKQKFYLGNGDLLLMNNCQKTHVHSIPKTKEKVGPRMNLTFRRLK